MSYYSTLTPEQRKNIELIVQDFRKNGVTNPMSIAGALAIVSKESAFVPKEEGSYATTANSRIRTIFGSRVAHLTEQQLTELKKDKKKFFNLVYSKTAGNNGGDDGSKYIGRSFNQLTGKSNYDAFGKAIGVDLVKNPELANDPKIAAQILVAYNLRGFQTLKTVGKLKSYNAESINDFKNLTDSVLANYHITAGSGKTVAYVKSLLSNDPLGGLTKAIQRVGDLYRNIVQISSDTKPEEEKKNICPHCSRPL